MVFSREEVIELSGGKKYFVVEMLNDNNIWYYYLQEVDKDETSFVNSHRIITTVSENGNLFIKSIKGKKAQDLELIFKEMLSGN